MLVPLNHVGLDTFTYYLAPPCWQRQRTTPHTSVNGNAYDGCLHTNAPHDNSMLGLIWDVWRFRYAALLLMIVCGVGVNAF